MTNTYDDSYLDNLLADLEQATSNLDSSTSQSRSQSRSASSHTSTMNSTYTSTSFEHTPRRATTSGITARFEYMKPAPQLEPLYQNDTYSQIITRSSPTPPPPPTKSQPPIYALPHRRSQSPAPLPLPPPPPIHQQPLSPANCSELDTLLNDLNARNQVIHPTKVVQSHHYSTVRSTRKESDRVNHLVTNLEKNLEEPSETRKYKGEEIRPITMTEFYEKKESRDQYIQPQLSHQPSHSTPTPKPARASSATHELDDLMAALHDFKMPNNGPETTNGSGINTTQSSTTAYRTNISKSSKMSSEHADYAVCKPRDQRDSARSTSNQRVQSSDQVDRDEHHHQHHQQQQQQLISNTSSAKSQHQDSIQQAVSNTVSGSRATKGPLESIMGNIEMEISREGVDIATKGRCYTCDKQIAGQVLTALGRTYHPEHFTCAHCDCLLGERTFFERDGRCYCEPDYEQLFAPRCQFCEQPIIAGQRCVTALDTHFHAEHFFCADCGSTFDEERGYHAHENRPYCSDCYLARFAAKCADCAKPIVSSFISALGGQWHVQCFVCAECRCEFAAGAFFELEGRPYCETHFHARKGTLCAGCHQPITGRCVTAMYRKFHPEHFVCSFCLKQLNKGTFKEQNDKPYCHGCFEKLFG